MEEGVTSNAKLVIKNDKQNEGVSEVDDGKEYIEEVSSQKCTLHVNKEEPNKDISEVDDDDKYRITIKDVLIILLTGLCLPTWDAISDNVLAGTLIYPQYCFEYSWPEYANKFGYDPNKCK